MAVSYQSSYPLHQKFERLSFQYESQLSVDSNMSSSSSTPSTPTSPIDYEIKVITAEDKEDVRQFLRTFFFADEPCNASVGLISEDNPICEDIETFAFKDFDNGVNLMAVYNDKLIGVCLNGILERGYLDNEKPFVCKNEKFAKVLKILEYVAADSDPFKKYPGIDKAMTVKILSVDGSYRGKGIAKELMNKTREIAREKGCGFMTVDCTSHFTACALKKLGFELHYSLNYADFKVNGQPLLKPAPPHKALTVYTQKL